MATTTLKTPYHEQAATVRISDEGAILSRSQMARVARILCGDKDCPCPRHIYADGFRVIPDIGADDTGQYYTLAISPVQ